MRFEKYLKENDAITWIVRKEKKGGKVIDQAFNSEKDAKKFNKLVKGRIFTAKGNAITPYIF